MLESCSFFPNSLNQCTIDIFVYFISIKCLRKVTIFYSATPTSQHDCKRKTLSLFAIDLIHHIPAVLLLLIDTDHSTSDCSTDVRISDGFMAWFKCSLLFFMIFRACIAIASCFIISAFAIVAKALYTLVVDTIPSKVWPYYPVRILCNLYLHTFQRNNEVLLSRCKAKLSRSAYTCCGDSCPRVTLLFWCEKCLIVSNES